MTACKPLLLAGTRVTGSEPHLGTLYGWFLPIVEARRTMSVCVLIADYQSLDAKGIHPLDETAQSLETALREFLPPDVTVVRESRMPSISLLGLVAATLFAPSHLKRVAPLRKLEQSGKPLPLSTLLYPAMMAADILALRATHVFNNPSRRFQHIDVVNDVLRRGSRRFGWPAIELSTVSKRLLNIPSPDGSGPMRRARSAFGLLPLRKANLTSICDWTARLPQPGFLASGALRFERCAVVRHIWSAVGGATAHMCYEGCVSQSLSCASCTHRLGMAIQKDLDTLRQGATAAAQASTAAAHSIESAAEEYAQRLLELSVAASRQE